MTRGTDESTAAGGPERGKGASPPFTALRRRYRTAGVIVLNTVLLVLALNLVLGAYYLAADALSADEGVRRDVGRLFTEEGAPVDNGLRLENQLRWYDFTALEGIEPGHAGKVLDDYYALSREGVIYQSWVQFSPPPFDGELIHVDIDERGFPFRRTTGNAPPGGRADDRARTVRIFTLGGSTTFGEEVSDDHTWPSHLAGILTERARASGYPHRVEVRNYGRPYYYPTQEVTLLADLLRAGHRPSLVIFMDGVNMGGPTGQPHFKPEVAEALVTRQHGSEVSRAKLARELRWVPMVRFALAVDHWLDDLGSAPEGNGGGLSAEAWSERVHRSLRRFEQARQVAVKLCELYGCRVLSFLQPNVRVGYNLDLYRTELPESFTSSVEPVRRFYGLISEDTGYINLSPLFAEWGRERKAVLDDLHYTPGFGRFLARRVAEQVELHQLPVFERVIDDRAASVSPRSLVTREGWLQPEDGWKRPSEED